MKVLLYIIPIILILVSCSDDPIKFEDDTRVQTIYGIERLYINGEKLDDFGNLNDNPCTDSSFKLVAYPNPSYNTSTVIQFFLEEEKEVEVSIETARASDELLDKLKDIGFEIRNHSEYKSFVFYTEKMEKGNNSVFHLMYIFGPGAYLIKIRDIEGNSECFPFIIVPNED